MQQFYDRYRWAEDLFTHRDYRAAARVLEALLDEAAARPDEVGHDLAETRLLLARAYYHSAQLRRAEATVRALLADHPTDAYAALLLARTLERGSRHDEAAGAFRVAEALGAPA
jgi:Tfp pilus assembly protein PilF